MDVSVTNASLPQIQGAIGATGTEGTWNGTGYLVAEVVMIPLTAWFARMMGMRNFLVAATVVFTSLSIMCGVASSLPQMIIGRVGQGFAGGAMIPASMTIIATRLPPRQQPVGYAVYATVALLAPVIGPLLGGWLTENASWHWLFFNNVPIGVVLVALLTIGMDGDPFDLDEFYNTDWLGLLGMTAALGGLTVVLEEGQRQNWLESPLIVRLTVLTVIGWLTLLISQFRTDNPIIRLKLLLDPSFACIFVVSMVMGAGAFVFYYLIPVLLALFAHYDAEQIGIVMIYHGIPALAMMPILPVVMLYVDARVLAACGAIIFAISSWIDAGMTAHVIGSNFIWSQALRGIGSAMVFMPMSQIATRDLVHADVPDGTALYSVSRNLGGSLGLALTGVIIERRTDFHMRQLGQAITANSQVAQERIAQIVQGLADRNSDGGIGQARALRIIAAQFQEQAMAMAYIDEFWIMAVAMIAIAPLALLIRKGSSTATAMGH